jgi:hypothetical protein
MPHTQSQVHALFKLKGLTLIGRYINNATAIKTKCRCGTIFFPIPANVFFRPTPSCGCSAYNKDISIKNMSIEKLVNQKLEAKGFKLKGLFAGQDKETTIICICGKEFITRPRYVIDNAISCGCKMDKMVESMKSEAYSKLELILSKAEVKILSAYNGRLKRLKLLCSCGEEFSAKPCHVVKSLSCGCGHRKTKNKNWRGHGDIPKNYFNSITSRGRIVSVTLKHIWELYLSQSGVCVLSHRPIDFKGVGTNFSASLDRIDSKLDYVEGNLQWLHKDVNRSKWDLDQNTFISMCKAITNYRLTKDDSISKPYDFKRATYAVRPCMVNTKLGTNALTLSDVKSRCIDNGMEFLDSSYLGLKHPHALKCFCGNIFNKPISRMFYKNQTQSCGCLYRNRVGKNHFQWKGVGDLSAQHFKRIIHNAKARSINFNVTIEDLWNLYMAQKGLCALSGLPIIFGNKSKHFSSIATASLDRIDSSKGYELGNIHWVHKHINSMKQDFSLDYFYGLCADISS